MAVKATASVTVFNVSDGRMLYATCPTAADTAAKVATVSSGTVALCTGLTVAVCFTHANAAESPTLDVNGTGARAIWVNGAAVTAASYWVAGATLTFVYDGTRWVQADADNVGNVDGRNYVANSATLVGDGLGSTAGSRREYLALDVGTLYSGLADGTRVTVSFDLVMQVNTVDGGNPCLRVYNWNNKGPVSIGDTILGFPGAAVGDTIEGRYSVTTSLSRRSDATLSTNYIEFYSDYGTSNWFRVSKLKLEVGSRATAWSPAPEDVASGIDTAQNTANAGIKEQVTLFYAAASATAPSKPTANVTTSSATTYAAWNRTLPTYSAANPYLYVCTQSLTNGGTYSWSAVESGNYADWAAALGTRLTTAETKIQQNTADIALKASQTEVSSLGTRVSKAEANIDANRAAIALKASKTELTNATNGSATFLTDPAFDRITDNPDGWDKGNKTTNGKITINSRDSHANNRSRWLPAGTKLSVRAIVLPRSLNSDTSVNVGYRIDKDSGGSEWPVQRMTNESSTDPVEKTFEFVTTNDGVVKPFLQMARHVDGNTSQDVGEADVLYYQMAVIDDAVATSAELEVAADSITQRVDDLTGDVATVTTTANEFSVQLQSAIADLTGDIDTNAEAIATVTAMVRVTSDNGRPVLGLGSSGSTLAVQLTNDQLSFLDSGQAVAYINGQRLYITTAEVTGMLRLGNFALVPQSDGSLALKLVG